ncbi:glucose-6-phosphate isomerase [Terasakiispira papahanaumokuakeensis]|uniref:Glucose-6-phosphate isomerase n=1 Tax=Terasakiispira papahanaumokuakeensis TaxID=197479 RepID=A0A1E2VB03_9GAMM|nr:glucose-6-phosphate isomerase [Terasakiispira papahanaumokuakeensis]ODC04198.1 glucose-6-phosphate isomerase [Terasakiispira papahanaumokuakeensis]
MTRLSALAHWPQFEQEAHHMHDVHLRDLHQQEPNRFDQWHLQFDQLLLDLSKQRMRAETRKALLQLAREAKLPEAIEALFTGQPVNRSEQRPALHTALRQPSDTSLEVDGEDIIPAIHQTLDHMESLVNTVRSGQWRGVTGHPITDVVNLGVGGSDLGPLMACHALRDFAVQPPRVHFVSTMDGSQLVDRLAWLNPSTTLFIFSSKSFTTADTLANAETARRWLSQHLGDEGLIMKRHFIGVSASPDKMTAWGIPEAHQLCFWEWVGGRYSLWSAIGLPIALKIGMAGFRELLAGAHALDQHFRQTPLEENLPVMLALTGVWNINGLNINAHAVLPYDGRMKYLPAYLEQLEMESNGKCTTQDDEGVDYDTCPVLWGELGPNAQHAFYQLLHQGTQAVNCDFIAPARRYEDVKSPDQRQQLTRQHRMTLANCFAQSRLLMLGDSALDPTVLDSAPRYRLYRGNQPSTTLLLEQLTPYSLGQLLALYEHKVFVQATLWDINPFDQWGVEMGKKIAIATEEALVEQRHTMAEFDSSTQGLMSHCLHQQEASNRSDLES